MILFKCFNSPFLNVFEFIKLYTNSFEFEAFAFHNNTFHAMNHSKPFITTIVG
jgi:hypothetical protein